MSTMLSDGNLHEKLAKLKAKDKGLFNKIKQFFEKMVAKFRQIYADLTPDQQAARDVRAMKDSFDKIQQAFAEALVDANENYQSSKTDSKLDAKDVSDIKESGRFSKQLDNIDNIPSGEALVVCGTPKVFTDIGLNNLPMTLNLEHAKDAISLNPLHKDRFIGKSTLKSLPTALESPIAIIASKTHKETSLVAIVELKGPNEKNIITPIYLNGLGRSNGVMMDVNAISSVHERNNAIKKLLADAIEEEANGNIGVFYIDNKKTTQLVRGEGLQLPNFFTSLNGSIHSISENGSPVKEKFKTIHQIETRQFKRWFGKSKVVDEAGTPMVVYHGTDAEFFKFDMGKSRANMDIQGAFFSPYKLDAQGYGKNVGAFYLSLQNPADERTAYRTLNRFKSQNGAGSKAREYLIQQGYDGVYNGYDEYIAFYPEQIKSATDNIGTFDGHNPDIRYSSRDYSYEALVSKPDMTITTLSGPVPTNRADVIAQAKKNAAKIGKVNPKDGSVSVHVDDIDTDVLLSTNGLKHSLDRRLELLAPVILNSGEILSHSIRINELTAQKKEAAGSYVLIGVARNTNGELYIVRSVINKFRNELSDIDVLYAINAKKEPVALNEPEITGRPAIRTSGSFTDTAAHNAPRLTDNPLPAASSTISIAELLDVVNQYFPQKKVRSV